MRNALLTTGWLVLLCSTVSGQPPDTDAYRAGLACFEQLDYTCAVDLLTAAAYASDGTDRDRWCDIHHKLAESQLALGRTDLAVEAFERLLSEFPDYQIDQPRTSPKIRAALDRARRRLERSEPPVPKDPPPHTGGPGTGTRPAAQERTLRLGLSGGAEFLVGEDSQLLKVGSVVDLELTHRYAQDWALGGGLRWTSHGASQADATVHLVGGWAGGGPTFDFGPVRLSGLVGFGVARFWVPGDQGKTALFVPVRLAVDFALHDRIGLGLVFSPAWLLSFGDFESSLTLDLSAGLSVGF